MLTPPAPHPACKMAKQIYSKFFLYVLRFLPASVLLSLGAFVKFYVCLNNLIANRQTRRQTDREWDRQSDTCVTSHKNRIIIAIKPGFLCLFAGLLCILLVAGATGKKKFK